MGFGKTISSYARFLVRVADAMYRYRRVIKVASGATDAKHEGLISRAVGRLLTHLLRPKTSSDTNGSGTSEMTSEVRDWLMFVKVRGKSELPVELMQRIPREAMDASMSRDGDFVKYSCPLPGHPERIISIGTMSLGNRRFAGSFTVQFVTTEPDPMFRTKTRHDVPWDDAKALVLAAIEEGDWPLEYELRKFGPTRVLIDKEGTADPAWRARQEHHIIPDIVFVRDDGWTLGAPAYLEDEARELWKDDWVKEIRLLYRNRPSGYIPTADDWDEAQAGDAI